MKDRNRKLLEIQSDALFALSMLLEKRVLSVANELSILSHANEKTIFNNNYPVIIPQMLQTIIQDITQLEQITNEEIQIVLKMVNKPPTISKSHLTLVTDNTEVEINPTDRVPFETDPTDPPTAS